MLKNVTELLQYKAEIGDRALRIADLFFGADDRRLRYAAVDTGGWVSKDEVLVPLEATAEPDVARRVWPVSTSREALEAAPGVTLAEGSTLDKVRDIVAGAFSSTRQPLYMREDARLDSAARAVVERYDRAGAWIGAPVFGTDGELGRLADLIVELSGLMVTHLVVDADGRHLAVPVERLRHAADDGHTVLDLSRARLDGAPEVDRPGGDDRAWAAKVRRYYSLPV